MPTLTLPITDTDFLALQEETDRFNASEARRPDAPTPKTALEFLQMQVQMRILDRYTQVKADADQDAHIQAILANPAAFQAAKAVLAASSVDVTPVNVA